MIRVSLNEKKYQLLFISFQGISSPLHVVEITVFPWKKEKFVKGKEGYNIKVHPVYEDEEGKCYFRRQASVVEVL